LHVILIALITHQGFIKRPKARFYTRSQGQCSSQVEISLGKGFTLGVKAEREKKNFSICPKLPINAEFYGLVLAPRLSKKDYHEIWKAQFGAPGAIVPAFINSLTSMC
jgi:hypothetical protein